MNDSKKLDAVKSDLKACTHVLAAIGDETRQLIMMALIDAGCDGLRVGEITAQTHLSRPAVSHHLKILKDAGIVQMYKVATMNYYYLDMSSKLMGLKKLFTHIEELLIVETPNENNQEAISDENRVTH
ncbi:transcriptional regulator [Paenibacillus pectinilyticus]|uniref:Transcriptional regulator n=1 Tax=Paenibacillus pectinilyticus TaxID=512399 RepID=A0A1C1A854_9BACL|nr:metalloregulator ArsR/SmtB family transcription factor [Paenibacillus pectinilyticus]OCT16786.1 transcriptional regulator [Paenibacillus pectinilyticus]